MNRNLIKQILQESRINLRKVTPEMFFQKILNHTSGITTDINYPDRIFYYDPDTKQINFEYDRTEGILSVRHFGIFVNLESDFNLDHRTVQGLIKNMVERHYKLGSSIVMVLDKDASWWKHVII